MSTLRIPESISESIQASIHQDAINRVSEFFNASNSDILNELLQNSRRSGATEVHIDTHIDRVSVWDNGRGISDPGAILAFGRTGWNDSFAVNEHPAGMGLYALARCEQVRIVSRSEDGQAWRVILTPDHFVGKLTAPVERIEGGPVPVGVHVEFTPHGPIPIPVLHDATVHYSLPVYLNGSQMERTDFLKGAIHTAEWQGIRIGVYPHDTRGKLNFHGIVVHNPGLPQVESIGGRWTARADVVDAPELQLTLPARREVVETPFMDGLRAAAKRAIYQAMALQTKPVPVPFQVQQDARDLSIELPGPPLNLPNWSPDSYTGRQSGYGAGRTALPVKPDTVILEPCLDTEDQYVLARAIEQNGMADRFRQANPQLEGYQWYDRLSRAQDVKIIVTGQDGVEQDLLQVRNEGGSVGDCRPSRIVYVVKTGKEEPDGTPVEIRLASDAAFESEPHGYYEDLKPLVTRDSGISINELESLMFDACYSPDDDYDADSGYTQEENCRFEILKIATEILSSKEEAVRQAIAAAVNRDIIFEVPPGMIATIVIQPVRQVRITLEPAGEKN